MTLETFSFELWYQYSRHRGDEDIDSPIIVRTVSCQPNVYSRAVGISSALWTQFAFGHDHRGYDSPYHIRAYILSDIHDLPNVLKIVKDILNDLLKHSPYEMDIDITHDIDYDYSLLYNGILPP